MWLFKLILIQLILLQSVWSSPSASRLNKRLAVGLEARGPSNIEYNVNILTKLNSNYVFPLVISQDERTNVWLLSQQTSATFASSEKTANTFAVYDPRLLPRNQTVADQFACLPSEKTCNQLSINNVDLSDIGVYTFRFDSSNYLTMKTFTFNVSAYFDPIEINCSSLSNDSRCAYNKATQTLSVLANTPVSLTCGMQVVQNDNYPVSAQFNFISELYGEECMGNTSLTNSNANLSVLTNPNNSKYNVIVKKLSKNCTRTFTKQDLSKSYSCQLNPIVRSLESTSYEQTKTYESLDIKLDVQYGPDPTLPLNPIPQSSFELFNKTQMVGDDIVKQKFICPFIGNPKPMYYWRVVSANTNGSTENTKLKTLTISDEFLPSDSQEFPIPSDLQVGAYAFECKAKVDGLIGKFSQTIRFNLNVIPQPPLPERNRNSDVNIGAIVGGIIGGIALLALITILIIASIRIARNNTNKNIEKAKEKKNTDKDYHPGATATSTTVTNEDDDDDDGGFGKNFNNLGEQSSLAQNKQISNILVKNQLPILIFPDGNSSENLSPNGRQSSRVLNNQDNNNNDKKFESINENTPSAHEFVGQTISQNELNYIDSSNESTKNLNSPSTSFGVYSPSTAEARHLDASAPDANLSFAARQAKLQISSNNSTSPTSPTRGIALRGGIKVLPTTSTTTTSTLTTEPQNPLESPPPYDSALHQPIKKDSPPITQQQQLRFTQQQQLLINQQQKDYMGSNARLISASNTPTQPQRLISHTSQSYTINSSQPQNLTLHNSSTPNHISSQSMQHLQYQNQANLQYTSVHNIENRARSRNPLNGPSDMENQQQQHYTTMAAQLSSNPIDV